MRGGRETLVVEWRSGRRERRRDWLIDAPPCRPYEGQVRRIRANERPSWRVSVVSVDPEIVRDRLVPGGGTHVAE